MRQKGVLVKNRIYLFFSKIEAVLGGEMSEGGKTKPPFHLELKKYTQGSLYSKPRQYSFLMSTSNPRSRASSMVFFTMDSKGIPATWSSSMFFSFKNSERPVLCVLPESKNALRGRRVGVVPIFAVKEILEASMPFICSAPKLF